MFSRISALSVLALALLAVATPAPNNAKRWATPPTTTVTVTAPASAPSSASSCSTGDLQCCDSVQSANSPAALAALGLLGIILQGVTAEVGLTCSPISVIGAGSSSCSASAVCCQDNSHGGLISIGCLPVTL